MRWIVLMIALATPVAAEPLPDLFDVLAEVNEREVQVQGNLIKGADGSPRLQTDSGFFSLRYALSRQNLKSAEACVGDGSIFNRTECPIRALAELEINGSSVHLLVFDIEFLDRD